MMDTLNKTAFLNLNPHYGLIAASGADALTFLQGQLTCDVREISASNPGFGAYCNLKGRIRALFRIFLIENTYYLQLPRTLLPQILNQLKKYVMFSKVTLKDASGDFIRMGIIGEEIKSFSEKALLILPLQGRIPRFEIIAPKDTKGIFFDAETQNKNFEYWKSLDIEARIPEIWLETTEQLLPHYINLPQLNAVSFKKGCYCGQEIIARMEYKAKIKRTLFRANLPNCNVVPPPGTKIYANPEALGEDIGTLVSSAVVDNTLEMLIECQEDYAKNPQNKIYLKNDTINVFRGNTHFEKGGRCA